MGNADSNLITSASPNVQLYAAKDLHIVSLNKHKHMTWEEDKIEV